MAVPPGLTADEAARHARPIAGILAPRRGDGDRHVGLAGEHGLDEGGGLDRGLPQIGREKQDVARRAVGTVAHGGDLHAGLDRRGAPALDGVTHDDGARGSRGTSGVVRGPIVDDNEEVNAGYGAARAHGGRNGATDIVGGDDCSDALRVGTS